MTFCNALGIDFWSVSGSIKNKQTDKQKSTSFTVKPVFQVTNLLVCISKTTPTKGITKLPC